MRRNRTATLSLGIVMALSVGCGRSTESSKLAPAPDAPRVERVQRGPIEVTVTVEPARVTLTRGVLLTISATAVGPTPPALPTIEDRLAGLELIGQYDGEVREEAGRTTLTRYFQLSPTLDSEHRIAPMAVTLNDDWVATPSIILPRAAVSDVPADIAEGLKPRWIPPAFRTVATWVVGLIVCIAVGILLWKLLKQVRRKIEIARMSPRERAMKELEELLARHLPDQDMVKEFYFELTMIVRRYIERAHRVRAPEQTTEEFLAAVSSDARFGPAVVDKLRQFMDSADLVKYAAYQPDSEAVTGATSTARDYIDTDADNSPTPSSTRQQPLATTHV